MSGTLILRLVRLMAQWQLLATVAVTVAWISSADTAQAQPEDYRVSDSRRELARALEVDLDRLRLNLPPAVDVSVGDIVSLTPSGLVEPIDRIAPDAFRVAEGPQREFPFRDGIPLRHDSDVWTQWFERLPETARGGGVGVRFREVQEFSLQVDDPDAFRRAVLGARTAIAAQRREKPLWLVTHVYRGGVELDMGGPPREARPKRDLSGWEVTPPTDEFGEWKFVARQPIALAFQGERLQFELGSDPNAPPADFQRQPGKVSAENAPPWERVRLMTASIGSKNGKKSDIPKVDVPKNGKKTDPEDDGNQVSVLYATSRQVQATPPTFATLLRSFVATTNGIFTIIGLAAVAIVALLWLGYAKRLTLVSTLVVLGICLTLYLVADAIDSVNRYFAARRPGGQFTGELGKLTYGIAEVSVPDKHRRGKLETPFSLYIVRFPEDPEKHFVITELTADDDKFFRQLQEKVAQSPEKNAFVFIHGYNVTFDDAVKRTAQLAVDLDFKGAPLCYAWPSQGELFQYVRDGNYARPAATRLREFLERLQAESGASEIHLIAHSMGNLVLTTALTQLGREHLEGEACKFREVLLTAPDIDAQIFEEEIVPAIRNPRQRLTLYASANDKALKQSATLQASRAGLAGEHLIVMEGLETIDVSALDTDFLGHSYYGDHRLVVDDMRHIINNHLPPPDRGLKEARKNELLYWKFVP